MELYKPVLPFAALVLYLAISFPVFAFSTRTESWSEDALLHDGRIIKVSREVEWTFQFLGGDSGSPVFMKSWPDKFWLKFTHPDTHKTIKWQGEQYFEPILLDIVDNIPYLVVMGSPNKSTEKIYGCPELPYIYLRYEEGFWGKWVPIPVEQAPSVLQEANLSPEYPDFPRAYDPKSDGDWDQEQGGRWRPLRDLSPKKVQAMIERVEKRSQGGFQARIPRNYDEWNYVYKNSRRNERKQGDCRPPLQPLPDIPLPKPVDVELETVESTDYIVKSANEYYKYLSEKKGTVTRANCVTLFRPPKPENLMLGERFVKDPTGNIRLPYSGPSPLPLGMLEKRVERYCDDKFVWFVAGHEELGKTIITKYSTSGDFFYNTRISNPKNTEGRMFAGKMVLDSITTENNFFYFYWNQDIKRPDDRTLEYPNRMLKFRFREPAQESIPR